jgi:hypothetical protein
MDGSTPMALVFELFSTPLMQCQQLVDAAQAQSLRASSAKPHGPSTAAARWSAVAQPDHRCPGSGAGRVGPVPAARCLPPELVELVELGIPRRLDAWGYGLSFSA